MEENQNVMEEEKKILADITNIKTQDTFVLPSKGLVYDPEENIPASITLRRMTTKEDKIRMRNEGEDKIRRDILQACILDPEVKAENLKLSDANFLLFRLRVLSLLDDIYKLQITCPDCGTQFIHEIKLSEVPVEYMNDDKLKEFTITLPLTKQVVTLKLPALKDVIEMGDYLKKYFAKYPEVDRSETIYITSAMLYVKEVNGQFMIKEELEQWLETMDIIDNKAFRKAVTSIDDVFGFDTNLNCQCPNCQKEIKHGLPITAELFNPSL